MLVLFIWSEGLDRVWHHADVDDDGDDDDAALLLQLAYLYRPFSATSQFRSILAAGKKSVVAELLPPRRCNKVG